MCNVCVCVCVCCLYFWQRITLTSSVEIKDIKEDKSPNSNVQFNQILPINEDTSIANDNNSDTDIHKTIENLVNSQSPKPLKLSPTNSQASMNLAQRKVATVRKKKIKKVQSPVIKTSKSPSKNNKPKNKIKY